MGQKLWSLLYHKTGVYILHQIYIIYFSILINSKFHFFPEFSEFLVSSCFFMGLQLKMYIFSLNQHTFPYPSWVAKNENIYLSQKMRIDPKNLCQISFLKFSKTTVCHTKQLLSCLYQVFCRIFLQIFPHVLWIPEFCCAIRLFHSFWSNFWNNVGLWF